MKIISPINSPLINTIVRLKIWGVLAFLLLSLAAPEANAFPVFCSDITILPDRILTGCPVESNPPVGVDVPGTEMAEEDDRNPSVDAILAPKFQNRQLFQVGRNALASPSPDDSDQAARAKGSEDQSGSGDKSPAGSNDTVFGEVTSDERWYYMAIDQDGTYLFLGDAIDMDDPANTMDEDSFLPDGIGIGKKWWF